MIDIIQAKGLHEIKKINPSDRHNDKQKKLFLSIKPTVRSEI